MNVLIVGPAYPFRGGIAHFAGCLYRELKREGHAPSIINFKNQYPSLIFPGKSQYEENSFFSDIESDRILTPYNPLTYKKTLRQIIHQRPDVVIFNFFIPFLAPAYIYLLKHLQKKGIKTVVIAHNIDFHEKWLLGKWLTKSLLKKAWRIIALSDAVYKDICQLYGESSKNKTYKLFHPLYDFYDLKKFTQKEAKQILNITEKQVILFYGYIKPYKGVDILIKSFDTIKKRLPDAVLLIVGEIYGDKQQYEDLIAKSAFSSSIILIDKYVTNEETELYFKAADVLAVPYRQATQSGVVQIAYSMKKGVVATPVGGLPEMVIEGKTGCLSKSAAERDFAEGVLEFFTLDRDMVRAHIEDQRKNLSWNSFVEKLCELI
jgi:glycosyltransferase involved in cell wall biosynthesis